MHYENPTEGQAPNPEAEKWSNMEGQVAEAAQETEATQETGFDGQAYIDGKKAELEEEGDKIRESLGPGSNATLKEQMAARKAYDVLRVKRDVLEELDPNAEGGVEGSAKRMLEERMKQFQEALDGQGSGILGTTEEGHIDVVEEISAICYLLSDIKFKKALEARQGNAEA